MGDAVSKLDMGDLLACRTEVLAEPLQRGVDRKVEIYVTQHLDLKQCLFWVLRCERQLLPF